jgi:hypothetical protein
MSEDHIGVQINGVLYVKFEDAKKLREGWDKADAEIEKLRAALREIECSHIPDQPAAFDCADLDWARRHVGKLRSVARAALGEKDDAKV